MFDNTQDDEEFDQEGYGPVVSTDTGRNILFGHLFIVNLFIYVIIFCKFQFPYLICNMYHYYYYNGINGHSISHHVATL